MFFPADKILVEHGVWKTPAQEREPRGCDKTFVVVIPLQLARILKTVGTVVHERDLLCRAIVGKQIKRLPVLCCPPLFGLAIII
ncbi:MAG: hypothetical protein JST74_11030 [Bacteroidetes bacterium]|nr:hypothetical protein [Bacteroidota bacterium]